MRVDLSFDAEVDARRVIDLAKQLSGGVVSIHEGESNEEISFYDLEICRHEEGLPCERLERVEVRNR